MNNKLFGQWCESKAAEFLNSLGFEMIERNVRFREGELDIICLKNGVIHFVEVKGRRNLDFGEGIEAVDMRKLEKMKKAAIKWRLRTKDYREFKFYFVGILESGTALIISHGEICE